MFHTKNSTHQARSGGGRIHITVTFRASDTQDILFAGISFPPIS